jgi:hypothetical protein
MPDPYQGPDVMRNGLVQFLLNPSLKLLEERSLELLILALKTSLVKIGSIMEINPTTSTLLAKNQRLRSGHPLERRRLLNRESKKSSMEEPSQLMVLVREVMAV